MDAERRSRLTILKRGYRRIEVLDSPFPAQSARDGWMEWADDLWNEIARVHALVDKVEAEMGRMLSDDRMHAIQVLEKSSEVRELQAYYKGLRYAIDRQKEIAERVNVGTARTVD